MSIFETSSELFDDSDVSSGSASESLSSTHISPTDSSSSSLSEDMPIRRRTRQSMGNRHSESSVSSRSEQSSDNQSSLESSHSSVNNSDSENMASSNITNDDELSNNSSTTESSDTETYDVDVEISRLNGGVIEINDTQVYPLNNQSSNIDDDDVILVPQNIETIDLCTQAAPVPLRLRNEVIDITDSPRAEESRAGPIRSELRTRRRRNAIYEDTTPQRAEVLVTSTPVARQQLNMDDSVNESQPRITLTCPICLDSVVNRQPVSTLCGHIFCNACIVTALQNAKKCPMCKKALGGRKPFFNIFLPC